VGQDRRVVLEPPDWVVAEQEHATPAGRGGQGFAHHDEVEEAIVVEVEECGVQAGDAAQLAPQLAGPRVRLEGAVPAPGVQRGAPPPPPPPPPRPPQARPAHDRKDALRVTLNPDPLPAHSPATHA